MHRRDFLHRLGAGAAGVWAASAFPRTGRAQTSSPAVRPNVLFITVDDLRPELGCYGNGIIKTPNIDRLAASGVTFTRAYCQQALCNPSRASLLSGLRPDSVKVWDLRVHFRDTVPEVVTLPEYFRKNGYRAEACGKVFHTNMDDRKAWDVPTFFPRASRLYSKGTLEHVDYLALKARAEGKGEAFIRDHVRGPATEVENCRDEERWDGEIAETAIRALYRLASAKQPFFLGVGFIQPHLPFVAPKRYWDLYDPKAIPEARNPYPPKKALMISLNANDELRDYEDFAETPPPWKGRLPEEKRRRLKHGYYASVSFIDAQVGRILNFLGRLGLAGNTIVVFLGDNGFKLGEHGSWSKMTNFEDDTRCPLIIRAPGAAGNGRKAEGLVEFVDLYPTVCGLAGLPRPDHLEGSSLGSLLNEPERAGKEAAFSQHYRRHVSAPLMGYTARTLTHRFVEWRYMDTGNVLGEELYDLIRDPLENVNIADSPENAKILEEMRALLRRTCPVRPRRGPALLASQSSDLRVELELVNELGEEVTIYEIDADGARRWVHSLVAGKQMVIDTFLTHPFVVESLSGEFHRVCYADYPRRRVVLRR
ncbi:MAG: sulfatase-like hydrolase/transferase [Candidatus Aminicenantes bacterium]|nr:sulfatase-like hydrolase/transferase [Candidatus Aminicenantes bacterium]